MTAGDVYTIAGNANGSGGDSGDGGLATSSKLSFPLGIALDSAGDVFIADSFNNRVQEIAATTHGGMTANDIYTIAGSSTGSSGHTGDGGAATSALLSFPTGLATDAAGDLFIADEGNNRIQEIPTSSGTQWGTSMTAGDFYTVAGSSTGSSGHTGDGSTATSALLDGPFDVAVDSAGDLYIADTSNNRVQEVAKSGGAQWDQSMTADDIYTIAGSSTGSSGHSGNGGAATSALLYYPEGITLDRAGNLYVADEANNEVREVTISSGYEWGQSMTADDIYSVVGSTAGTAGDEGDGGPAGSAELDGPSGVSIDAAGNLLIADSDNNLVREVTQTAASDFDLLPTPSGITLNEASGSQVTYYPEIDDACTSPYQVTGGFCALPSVFSDLTLSDGTYSLVTGGTTTSTYNSTGQLAGESDSAGNDLTITYDSPSPGSGDCPDTATSCETITSASGRALVLGFNSSNEVTSVTDPMDRIWTYGYDEAGDLTSATDPMSNETSYTYDTSNPDSLYIHDILTVTKPNGQSGGPDAGDKTTNTYDSEGRVATQTDPAGWETTFNYNGMSGTYPVMDDITGDGQVIVTDPDGNETAYDYQSGLLDAEYVGFDPSSTQPDPSDTVYSLDAATLGDDVAANPDGDTTQNTYGTTGLQTKSIAPATTASPSGAETTNSYSSLDLANCSTSVWATSACSSLSPPSPVTHGEAITGPGSAPPIGVTYTEFDNLGNALWTTTGVYEPGDDETASYSQTTYQLFAGNTLDDYTISCDESPPSDLLPCATVNADGVVTQLEYDSEGDLTSSSTPYDSGGDLATTTYGYNGDGEQTSTVSPDGNVEGANAGNYTTVTAYNSDGETTSVTEGDGSGHTVTPRETSYGYDGDGNKTSSTDARGYATDYTFNAEDQQTLVTNPDSDSTLTCYDGAGNVTETVPAVGVVTNSLSPASCPTSYPTDYGERLASDATTDTYNAEGQQTASTTPAPAGQSGSETTTYTYDESGNLIETVAPATSDTEDAPDQVTLDGYDQDGQLASETVGAGADAASTTSYCYDPAGNQTAVVAPDGNVSGVAACSSSSPWTTSSAYQTTYSYDSLGELASTTRPVTSAAPDGATTIYAYDDAGNMLTSEDPNGVTTTDTYTPMNKIHETSYSDDSAPTVTFTYDAQGNRTEMEDGTGDTTYVYDSFGELTSEENGDSQTVGYSYDADGDVTGITYPLPETATWADSDTVTYNYDDAGDMTSLTDFNGNEVSITNSADGLPTDEELGGSGDSIDTTYDSTDSPSDIELTDGSSLLAFSYSDAPSGAILTETDTPSSSSSPADYSYDAQGRVTSMTPGEDSELDYEYDASDALTTLPNEATGTYDDAGELISSSVAHTTTDYTYDAEGNQLESTDGDTTVSSATWNGAGELNSYANQNATISSAAYDGDGLRMSATFTPSDGPPSTDQFTWATLNTDSRLLMDSLNAYVYGPGQAPIEQLNLTSGSLIYTVADALGSVRGVLNASGSVLASASYDAWGNPQPESDLTSYTPFGFAAGYTDITGLLYLIKRYYSPLLGAFLSVDPMVRTTLETYSYADDNPLSNSDPNGEFTLTQCETKLYNPHESHSNPGNISVNYGIRCHQPALIFAFGLIYETLGDDFLLVAAGLWFAFVPVTWPNYVIKNHIAQKACVNNSLTQYTAIAYGIVTWFWGGGIVLDYKEGLPEPCQVTPPEKTLQPPPIPSWAWMLIGA